MTLPLSKSCTCPLCPNFHDLVLNFVLHLSIFLHRFRISRLFVVLLLSRAICTVVWAVSSLIGKVAPRPPRPQIIFSSFAVSASFWKVAPSPLWSEKSRRFRLGLESRAVFVLVWRVAPSLRLSGKLYRIYLNREQYNLGRAASASVWKIAPSPSWSEGSRCLRLGLESRVVSALVWKIAPFRPWSGKSRRLSLGPESRAVCTVVRTVSTLNAKVAPLPLRSR